MLLGATLAAATATGLIVLFWSRSNRRITPQTEATPATPTETAHEAQRPAQPRESVPDTAGETSPHEDITGNASIQSQATAPHGATPALGHEETSSTAKEADTEVTPGQVQPALDQRDSNNSQLDSKTHDSTSNDAATPNPTEKDDAMRITKRSSGGRGEYEISEAYLGITPVHILDRQIILDLGDGLDIVTGVHLLLRHGKRRLRIDDASGCDMHLHRQLAAALMLPHPARDESAWASGAPIIRSDLYGIANIALSEVQTPSDDKAKLTVSDLTLTNNNSHETISATARMAEIRKVWEHRSSLPEDLSLLVEQHEQFVRSNGPLQSGAENLITAIQRSVFANAHSRGLSHASPSLDPLPTILRMIGLNTLTQPAPTDQQPSPAASAAQDVGPSAPQALPHAPIHPLAPSRTSNASEAETSSTPAPITPSENGEEDPQGTEPPIEPAPHSPEDPPSPRRYQPQRRAAAPGPPRRREPVGEAAQDREISAPIEVRLRHRTGGTYLLSFLPRRRSGAPAEVDAINANEPIHLSALHEDWYQDITIPAPDQHLRHGMVIHTDHAGQRYKWMLSGRDLYVLGTREELTGFVSTTRLEIGGQHVVLCTEQLLSEVLPILRACCDREPETVNESDGLPHGWVALRPVIPTRALPPSAEGHILDAIRPDPTIRIELEEGIRLQNNSWLIGHPPVIRIHGEVPDFAQVTIDGQQATRVGDSYVTEGFDVLGEHSVACGPTARTYEIVKGQESWEPWPAHVGPARGAGCVSGALVSSVRAPGSPALLIPAATPVLIGRRPEEVYVATVRTDVRTAHCLAFPGFTPVWAVPQHPLQVQRATTQVLHLGGALEPLWERTANRIKISRNTLTWYRTVLDCHRKGLIPAPLNTTIQSLWRSYKKVARNIRRALR